jgi:hypothetical protein
MTMPARTAIRSVIALSALSITMLAHAAEPNCTQNPLDGTTPPKRQFMLYPAQTVVPFYQWQSNNGYCGEVSMIQAGLNHGQWVSQFSARLLCGTGLLQSGPRGWCRAHNNQPHHNAQLLLETPGTGVTGPNDYANAPACLSNARLAATTYPYLTGFHNANGGVAGYQDFLSWIKSEVLAGHQVTIGVLLQGGNDPQSDHIVSVTAIGTNHPASDASYHGDDVLYFDDHGLYNLDGDTPGDINPAIPMGAGSDNTRCTPYIFGYTFDSLARTRAQANRNSAQAYSIVIPGVFPTDTINGGDGENSSVTITGHNYGFSVSGAIDNSAGGPYLLPIRVTIPRATYTNGRANPRDPKAGWQYENSMIGSAEDGTSCTNAAPRYRMRPLTLKATISGLTPGAIYNLYEYTFERVEGIGAGAALAVPTENFNQNAIMATRRTQFTATKTTYVHQVRRTSKQIVVFRAVPAGAP